MRGAFLAGVLGLCVLACTCTPEGVPEEGPPPTSAELEAFAHATNELGWRVYERLAAEGQPNVVYSPVSTHIVLAMVEAGAEGDTKRELLTVLNGGGPEQGLQRAAGATLRRWLTGWDSPVEARSRVFVIEGPRLREGFADAVRSRLGGSVQTLDFAGDPTGSASEIAAWLQEFGAPSLSLPIDESTRLVAVNQLHFDGPWRRPFPPSETHRTPFFSFAPTVSTSRCT